MRLGYVERRSGLRQSRLSEAGHEQSDDRGGVEVCCAGPRACHAAHEPGGAGAIQEVPALLNNDARPPREPKSTLVVLSAANLEPLPGATVWVLRHGWDDSHLGGKGGRPGAIRGRPPG